MKELRKHLKFAWQYAKEQKNKILAFAFCNAFQIFISIVVPIIRNPSSFRANLILFNTILIIRVRSGSKNVFFFFFF